MEGLVTGEVVFGSSQSSAWLPVQYYTVKHLWEEDSMGLSEDVAKSAGSENSRSKSMWPIALTPTNTSIRTK
jgi:hypothetical protein